MSILVGPGNIFTAKAFAAVPPLLNLPEIQREPASVSNLSSCHEPKRHGVDLAEGCILTKSVMYAHKITHFVNAARKKDAQLIQDILEFDMGIIPYEGFTLDDPCNLAFLDPFVHTSLDRYAFIALAPSSSTVEELISMVESDNDSRLQDRDPVTLITPPRQLNFKIPSFTNPEYELVVLHPEHFLPRGAVLPVYDLATETHQYYVPSHDRRLRKSIESDSACLPPFRHVLQNRHKLSIVNIFLVAINAEIKFQQYFKMIENHPPPTPLPGDVIMLMRRVMELVHLLYWKPPSTEGLQGYSEGSRRNPVRAGRLAQMQYREATSGEKSGASGEDNLEDSEMVSDWQGYTKPQGFVRGIVRGRGKGMDFTTLAKTLTLGQG